MDIAEQFLAVIVLFGACALLFMTQSRTGPQSPGQQCDQRQEIDHGQVSEIDGS